MRRRQPEKGADMAATTEEYFVLKVEGWGSPTTVRIDRAAAVARAKSLARKTKSSVLLFKAIERYTPVLPEDPQIEVLMEVLS
jgi:hypothetical protein